MTDVQRDDLQTLRQSDLPSRVRDRFEMVFLSDAGWSPPAVADHLGYHPATVRGVLKDFAARGDAALRPGRTGFPPDAARRADIEGVLRDLLGRERVWTAGQLAEALADRGFPMGPRQARRYLRGLGARWKRTAPSLKHKQDPEAVAAAKIDLAAFERRAEAGLLDLYYFDECGFAPSMPAGYSWCPPGGRKLVPRENTENRRVNVLAAYLPRGAEPGLAYHAEPRTLTGDDVLEFLSGIPARGRKAVVVLDNAGVHTGGALKAGRAALAEAGVELYFLPAYSPELNRVEAVFKQVKHYEIHTRSFTTLGKLSDAVKDGFDRQGYKIASRRAA